MTPQVAILSNPESELMGYCLEWNSKPYHESMVGCHQALAARNVPLHFVHPREVVVGRLVDYKVLVMPHPLWLSPELANAIRNWVAAGGVLIAEALFACRNPANGYTWPVLPGLSFDEVFGAREVSFSPRWGFKTNADRPEVSMTTTADLPGLPTGSQLVGRGVMEVFEPTTGAVLATHADGRPGIVANQFGRGRAVILGSFLGAAYRAKPRESLERLLLGLLPPPIERHRPEVLEGLACVRTLAGDGREWLYVENLADTEQSVRFSLPGSAPAGEFAGLFSRQQVNLAAQDGRRVGGLRLGARAVGIFASR